MGFGHHLSHASWSKQSPRRTAPFRRAFRPAGFVPRRDVLELPPAFLIFHGLILFWTKLDEDILEFLLPQRVAGRRGWALVRRRSGHLHVGHQWRIDRSGRAEQYALVIS